MMNLPEDVIERLDDLYDTEVFKDLIMLLKTIIDLKKETVLNYNLKEGNAEQLAYLRSEVDGAKKVLLDLESFMKKLRKQSGSGVRRLNHSAN